MSKSKVSNPSKLFFVMSLTVACSALLAACNQSNQTNDVKKPLQHAENKTELVTLCAGNTSKIETVQAKCEAMYDHIKTTGEVLANSNSLVHVNSAVTGRATHILACVGQHVQKGDTLLYLRSTEVEQIEAELLQKQADIRAQLKQDLLQIDSDIKQAAEQVRLSESIYEREKKLVDEKIAARSELERATTEYDKEQIALDTLREKRKSTIIFSDEKMRLTFDPLIQKLELLGVTKKDIQGVLTTKCVDPIVPVVTPQDGTVVERKVNVGEMVSPDNELFTLGDFATVWLKGDVYEKDVSKIHLGETIEFTTESVPGKVFRGFINYSSDLIDPVTRTLVVRAEVANPLRQLKPKMFGEISICTGRVLVTAVPAECVQDAGSSKVVFVPKANGFYEKRRVKTGLESHGKVQLLAGIRPGESVVTGASFDLEATSLKDED